MESNEFCSPGLSKQTSFGLLDEKEMQDLSMENLNKVRDKPPIPFKQINQKILQSRQLNNDKSLNFDMNENPDFTQESVHLNESDLRQLEYEYTIDVDDDDDEDKENLKSYKTKLKDMSDIQLRDSSKNYGYSFAKTDLTSVSPDNFKDLDKSIGLEKTGIQTNISNDLLIDESSNILRNSNEFDSTTTDQTGQINYDKMDEINEKCQNRTQNSTLNFSLDTQNKNFQNIKPNFSFADFDATPKAKQSNESESNLFNNIKEKSATFNLTGVDDTINCINQLTIDHKKHDQSKINDTTLNFSSNLSSINHSVQQSIEKVKRIGQGHLLNFPEDYVNLISKPSKDQRYSTSTVRLDPKNMTLNFSQDVPLTPCRTFNQTIEPQIEPKIIENNFKKVDNPFDQSTQAIMNSNPFENPFDNSLGNFGQANIENTFSQFKQSDDFLEQLNQDEQINRKEFADNELTLMNQTSGNSSNESISSKWWKNPNTNQPTNLEISGIANNKQVKVDEFFMVKSELPSYLAEKESDVLLDETLNKDVNNTNIVQREKNSKKEHSTPQDLNDITFSSSNQGSATCLSSSNFSFTLNSSDTGEFIQPKNMGPKTPFQVTKALETLSKKKDDSKSKNLDKINEELDKVQNRLEQKHNLNEPLMSSSIKMSQTNNNLKSMIQMDETISSINSSDICTQKISNKAETKTSKDSKTSKISSGSLTSTPSKMTKSISESSNLNSITTNSLMEKFYKSENQDSFISSIPERNDSSLILSNRLNNKNKQKTTRKSKNAEIQTTPDSSKTSQHDENRQSISNVSSSSSNSSDPSNTINNQFNMINNLAAAMINSSTNSNNPGNGLVPVAFIPLNSFIPCVQKFYDDMQTTQGLINKTNMSSNLSTNSLNQAINTKLFVDTICTNSTSSLPSLNYGKFELPLIEFDKNLIDFGHVAEGCYQTLRIHGKLQNSNAITKTLGSYFQIELADSTDWTIESYESDLDEKTKKLDEDKPNRAGIIKKKFNEYTLKSKFRKTLSIFPDKNFDHLSSNYKVQLDLMSNFYEFFIQLNTKDLFFFKELISQLDSNSVDQLEPLQIKTSLYIYFYFNNSDNLNNQSIKKYLLNRIDVKFVLGYGRLRTNITDVIEFEIPEEISDSNKQESFREDIDKTLTSVDDVSLSKNCHLLEQAIPLSNAGNIDIEVDCYLSQNDEQITSIKFRDYEFKLDESLLYLQSKSRHKQFARIIANKLNESQLQGSIWEPKLDNVKLIVEVKPNGFRYEIPICLKFIKKIVEVNKNLGKNLKLASSRSILFFGKSLNSCIKFSNGTGLNDELTVANVNNIKIKVHLSLINSVSQNCFKFNNEMAQIGAHLNESMDQMSLVLEPSENFRLKLRFLPPQNFDSSIISGTLKMTIHGSPQKYTIQLIGFMYEAFLDLDNGMSEATTQDTDPLNSQLTYRNIRNFKYSIEFMQTTNSSLKNIYRKIVKLKNKSQHSKLIVYPCVFNKKLNKELLQSNSKISKFNEICYDLGIDSKSYANKLRILISKENQISSNSNDLSWFEIKPDELYALNLEIISQKTDTNKQDLCNLEDYNLCLFWIEYDINAYCTQSVQNANPVGKLSTNFIDLFINKLLINNNFFSTQNNFQTSININDSSAKLHRLSSISSSSLQDQSCLSNNSFVNKSKFIRNDFMRLMCQAVKCSVLNLITQVFSFDETIEKKEDLLHIDLIKDEKVCDLIESWSVTPSNIVIESLKINDTRKIFLKNNLSRKQLEFDVKYRTNYLTVLPSNGILEPNGSIELVVKPRSEVFSQLPWFSVISIWCNKIQKDVRVSFYSQNTDTESHRSLEMSKMKNLTNSSINTLNPTLISTSTPFGNSIESGTIISDLSQYTIDSLSLTPLINASFINVPSSNSFSVNKTKSFSLNSTTDDSITKIVREGNDANVRFPPVAVTQRKSVELTLTNPTDSYVKWKAYSTVPAFVRLKDNENKLIKSNYSVFLITPNSGSIPPNLSQKIKIEFCPREVYGQFNQYWEIDTRTDIEHLLQSHTNNGPISYTCKLILTGTSIPIEKYIEQKLVQQDDETSSRLANRILKSKTNNFNDSRKDNDKNFASSSSISQSLLSSSSNSSTSGTRDRVFIKDEVICFPDTEVNQTSKCFVTIHNRKHNVDCKISVYTLMEPFYCKHADLSISSNHYVKIPIEFRPKAVGDYTDKVLIKVDLYDVPLSCVIKAKCVHS